MGSTQPMQAVAGASALLGDSNTNTMAMGAVGGDDNDSEFELAGLDDDDDDLGTDTGVLMFDDEEGGDDFSATSEPAMDSAEYDAEDAYEDDLGDDDFADDFDDEEMDDVWDAEDEDDDEGFDAGESTVGGVATAGCRCRCLGRPGTAMGRSLDDVCLDRGTAVCSGSVCRHGTGPHDVAVAAA